MSGKSDAMTGTSEKAYSKNLFGKAEVITKRHIFFPQAKTNVCGTHNRLLHLDDLLDHENGYFHFSYAYPFKSFAITPYPKTQYCTSVSLESLQVGIDTRPGAVIPT